MESEFIISILFLLAWGGSIMVLVALICGLVCYIDKRDTINKAIMLDDVVRYV